MIDSKNRSSINQIIYELVMLVYFGFVFIRPTTQQFNTTCTVLFFICIFIMLRSYLTYELLATKEQFLLYAFALFLIATSLPSGTMSYTLKQVMFLLLFFSPSLVYQYIVKRYRPDQMLQIIRIVLIIWFFITILACYFYATHFNAARRLATDVNYYGNIAIGGGYDFACSAAILLVYLIGLPKRASIELFRTKTLYIIFTISLIVLIVMTKSTIILLIMVLGCIYAAARKRSSKGGYIFFVLSMFIILLLLLFQQQTGQLFINLFGGSGSLYEMKLSNIGEFLLGSEDNTLAIRLNLMSTSLKTTFDNLLIGVGYKYGYQNTLAYSYGIGGHSEIIDSFAKYGLIGFTLYFSIYYSILKKNEKCLKIVSNTAYVFTLFFLAVLNPLNQLQSSWTVFFIIPTIGMIMQQLLQENIY